MQSSNETILLKGKGATEPRRLFLSLTQGHSTSAVQNPNMTLKMGCKASHTPHPPSLRADIKYCVKQFTDSLSVYGCWLLRSQQTGAQPLPFIQLRGQLRSHSERRTPGHRLVFNNAVCTVLLSQVAKNTLNRTIWNTVPTHLQKLTGWLVTTSHPGLNTTAKLCTGNLKSRTLSYNLEFKLTDFINTGEAAQQLHAEWDRSSPTCLSPQPHSSHCISSIQPTPSSDASTEQWHFGKGH